MPALPTGRGKNRKGPRQAHRGPTGACKVCLHPERGRIDFLICNGAMRGPLAKQFGLSADSVYRHARGHISEAFRRSIQIGPLKDQVALEKLCAQNGRSVLENLQAIYASLTARFLAQFEAGGDQQLTAICGRMLQTLEMQAKLTNELRPAPGVLLQQFNQTIVGARDLVDLGRDLMGLVREFPQIRERLAEILRNRVKLPSPMELQPALSAGANGHGEVGDVIAP